jgi:hypothetical protein
MCFILSRSLRLFSPALPSLPHTLPSLPLSLSQLLHGDSLEFLTLAASPLDAVDNLCCVYNDTTI